MPRKDPIGSTNHQWGWRKTLLKEVSLYNHNTMNRSNPIGHFSHLDD
jgi:hypothetical protein